MESWATHAAGTTATPHCWSDSVHRRRAIGTSQGTPHLADGPMGRSTSVATHSGRSWRVRRRVSACRCPRDDTAGSALQPCVTKNAEPQARTTLAIISFADTTTAQFAAQCLGRVAPSGRHEQPHVGPTTERLLLGQPIGNAMTAAATMNCLFAIPQLRESEVDPRVEVRQ